MPDIPMPTQKGLWLISFYPGHWLKLSSQCDTSEAGTRGTLNPAEPLLLLFPVKCFVRWAFTNQILYSKALYHLGKCSPEQPCLPPHPTSGAACTDCLWLPEVCVGSGLTCWGCLSAGVPCAQEIGFSCIFSQDHCISVMSETSWGHQGCPLDAE